MDVNLLKYEALLKVVEVGSFTRAAESLFRSQSSVSRMISDLEQDWGVVLLERKSGGVSLTPEGIRLLPYIRQVCEGQRHLQEQVDELNGIVSGVIRIGTFSSVATHWLPNIVREFQKDYPRVEYEFLLGDYSEIENWIMEGRVDCGFLRLPVRQELNSIFMGRDEQLAVLPEGHPLAKKECVSAAELCREPFLLLKKGGRTDVAGIFEAQSLEPSVRFTTWDDYAIMSMVESGLGVSILPALILRRSPYRIVTKPLEEDSFREIGFAFRNGRTLPKAVTLFIEYLKFREQAVS